MTRIRKLTGSFLPIALALGLAACGGQSEEVSATAGVAKVAVSGGGVTVDVVTVGSPWQGGFNGAVRLTNTAFPAPIKTFQIVFKMAGNAGISNAWNGTISAADASGNRTATNPDWLQYQPIATGASWDVGFNGSGTFSGSTIVSVVINGQTINLGGPGDTTPPTVSLTASPTALTAPGNVNLTATASDNSGTVSRVEIYDNGALVNACTKTAAPFTCTIAMTSANNGSHSYTAKAYDPSSNSATSGPVIVTVNIPVTDTTPPTVSLTASPTTVTAAGNVTLTATASDAQSGISQVAFLEGTTVIANCTRTATPYTCVIPMTSANNGTHSYTARATNGATLSATSAAVTVTVNIQVQDTTPPTVSITASPTTVTAAGNITLTATAADAQSGISKVEFLAGTTVIASCTKTAAPFTCAVPVTAADNGTKSYSARATNGAGLIATSPAVQVTINIQIQTGNAFRVNAQGRITRNGTLLPFRCGSWFGLQGRYEPSYDSVNPRGAPMELYMGNTFWANGGQGTGRTVAGDLAEIKAAGINVVRFPIVHQTLDANDPQGRDPYLKNYSAVRVANSRLALEQFLKAADAAGVYVMLDIHSCSNYVDWRKGRLDARPPWVDATRDNYDYKREDCSCAPDGNPSTVTRIQAYNEALWLQDLKTLAGFEQSLGVHNIIGIDIFNEPWDYSWAEWKKLTEDAYAAINSVNPNVLLFVQGIGTTNGNQDGTPTTINQTPFGNPATNANWGENLFEAGSNPLTVPKDRFVFMPHTYGPSVFVQKQFMDPAQTQCAGLEGDAAGDAKCNLVINPTLLRQGWEEHFGYLKQLGYGVMVGEFGGNMEWPKGKASLRDQARFGYLTDTTTDEKWQNALVDYMVSKGIEGCYWSINPESGDTGGWYNTPYDPVSNTGGWGEWGPFQPKKTTLLNRLWSGIP